MRNTRRTMQRSRLNRHTCRLRTHSFGRISCPRCQRTLLAHRSAASRCSFLASHCVPAHMSPRCHSAGTQRTRRLGSRPRPRTFHSCIHSVRPRGMPLPAAPTRSTSWRSRCPQRRSQMASHWLGEAGWSRALWLPPACAQASAPAAAPRHPWLAPRSSSPRPLATDSHQNTPREGCTPRTRQASTRAEVVEC